MCLLTRMGGRTHITRLFKAVHRDARHWQILALSGLFCLSLSTSDFSARPMALLAAIIGAMSAQAAGTVWVNARKEERRAKSGSYWRGSSLEAGFVGWMSGFQWALSRSEETLACPVSRRRGVPD